MRKMKPRGRLFFLGAGPNLLGTTRLSNTVLPLLLISHLRTRGHGSVRIELTSSKSGTFATVPILCCHPGQRRQHGKLGPFQPLAWAWSTLVATFWTSGKAERATRMFYYYSYDECHDEAVRLYQQRSISVDQPVSGDQRWATSELGILKTWQAIEHSVHISLEAMRVFS